MIDTPRLVLRPWQPDDLIPFHELGQDAEVMLHLGPAPSLEDCRGAMERMRVSQEQTGFCFWAVERRDTGRFIGFCGLKRGKPPIGEEIEIGWRLARDQWGQGLAREAAEASLGWGWAHLDVAEIVAITTVENVRSRRLMEGLGMVRRPDEDFDAAEFPAGHPLRRHVLYRTTRPQ
ncbi:Protein N-acetyltransferase, RimJ/RimL family [Sphingomonas gellani]|uniref:Protein N-acetyltransferase, RimJ/RimL family n=1 Tax=Sphingomonas gellani TaxID=1166340 RepID=A0A1H7ZDP6_9SPHN|nr:GNAT family N-acetyltransferase [Sphingomonas gellani]SEM56383.1 Protein N-acetyltransferase, RimJ/RimL family [Sphingomonas gellani]